MHGYSVALVLSNGVVVNMRLPKCDHAVSTTNIISRSTPAW